MEAMSWLKVAIASNRNVGCGAYLHNLKILGELPDLSIFPSKNVMEIDDTNGSKIELDMLTT